MKSEIVLQKEYRGYELIVRKLSFEPWEMSTSLYQMNDHWYCGYAALPKENLCYGIDYTQLEPFISVHGGLTFSGELKEVDGYLIGFDCNHGGDDPLVQDEEYTLKECESLVDQLIYLSEVEE